MRRSAYVILAVSLLVAVGMVACGGGNGGGKAAVPTGFEPTVIGNSTFTRAVETDGRWVIWEAKLESLLMWDGGDLVDLTENLGPEYTLVRRDNNGGEECYSYISFDGRYAAFLADNVLDDEYAQVFYVDTDASDPTPVQISEGDYAEPPMVVDGVVAWLNSADDVMVYDIAGHSLSSLGVEVSGGQFLVGGGYVLYVGDNGGQDDVIVYEFASATFNTLTDTATSETGLVGGNGYAAWVDANDIWYASPGVSPAKATSTANAPSNLAIGNSFIAYEELGDIYAYQIGDPAGSVFAEETTMDPEEIAAGDGIIAFIDGEDVFYLVVGDGNADIGTVVDNGTNITDRNVRVEGEVIYWVQDMNDLGTCDPSAYVASYNTAVASSIEYLNGEYMRVWDPEPMDGKVVFNSRDANWGLYAQKVTSSLNPIALTPHEYNVAGDPEVDDGLVVFKALDRDNVADPGNGDKSMEVYYVDLDTSSKNLMRVTMNDELEDRIHIEGGLIVFNLNDSSQAMVYDVGSATGYTIWTNPSTWDIYMGVGDGIVAWAADDGGGWDIRYYDTEAASPSVQTLVGAEAYYSHPRIVGNVIVWRGNWTGSGYPVFYHQVGDPLDSIGRADVNRINDRPDFDGDFIVWNGYSDNLLWYFDMATSTAATIGGTEVYGSVRIDEGIASWTQDNDADGDLEVFYCDLNAATITTVKLTDNVLWDSRARNSGGTIVFRTGGSGNWDWDGMIAAAARQ